MRIPWLMIAATLASVPFLGCDNDRCGPGLREGQERIVGSISCPNGAGENAHVHIESVIHVEAYSVHIWTMTDEDGWFLAFVPPGAYFLSIEPENSRWIWYSTPDPTYVEEEADTLWIYEGGGTTHTRFVLGALDLVVQLPPDEQVHSVWCNLRFKPGLLSVANQSTSVDESEARFSFSCLTPGTYLAAVTISGGQPYGRTKVWLSSALDPTEADSFGVHPMAITSWSEALPSAGHVRGSVQGCWELDDGGPPGIMAYGSEALMCAEQTTDGRGEFNIPVYASGSVRFAISAGGRTQWVGGTDYESASEFTVSPGATVDIEFGVSCILCRTVGQPGWGQHFGKIRIIDASDRYWGEVQVGCDGEAAIVNLAPGIYYLAIMPTAPQPWRPQWFDRSPTQEGAAPVEISTAGETVEVTFTLEEGGKIRGRVLDLDGRGAAGLRLEVFAANLHSTWPGIWRTDSDGSFVVEGLPDDDIIIGARHPYPAHSRRTWYPGTAIMDSAEVITITDAQEVAGIEWQLLP